MTREQLRRTIALVDISDDYENLEHVVQRLARAAEPCRELFDRQEVIDTLSELIRTGLARAYRLSHHTEAEPIVGVPSFAEFNDDYVYFYLTDEGKSEVDRMIETGWPFDENGKVRPEFCPSLKG